MKKFRAIVFDLDGTIVDSSLDFNKMRNEIGMPENEPILEYIEKSTDDDFIKHAHEVIHRHELEGAHKSELIRDFSEFYLKIQKLIPMGILTRNSIEVTNLTLQKFNLNFEQVITRECARPKPSPEGLLIMADKWGIPPSEILYIGDFLFDIQTAKNANCTSALIKWESNQKFQDQADIVFDQYNELLPYLI